MMDHRLGRRAMLLGTAAAAAAGIVGCTSKPSSPSGVTTPPGSTSVLPNYVPFEGLAPDLPSNANGVPAAFLSYPKNPVSYAKTPVSNGASVSVLTPTNGGSPPKGSNTWWQNLQRVLGIDLNMSMVPGVDLTSKQQAMLAGGDIPDIAIVNPNNVPLGALQKYFTDLGPYLSGDAVKEYKALAAIPSLAWRTPTIGGTLFGIPQPRVAASYTLGLRADVLAQLGLTADIKDGDDLIELFRQITDAKAKRWAFGQDLTWLLRLVQEMNGVPNGANAWSEANGKFTANYETDGMKQSLETVARIWKLGYAHPESAMPNAAWFPGGTVASYVADFSQFPALLAGTKGLQITLVPAPKWSGGGLAVKQLNAGASGNYAAFKKADEGRIRTLLGMADFLAAPVGTTEYLTANFGEKGVGYTFDGPDPVRTGVGDAERYSIQALGYVTSGSLSVLYTPGQTEFVKHQHEFLTKVMQQTYFNPTIGLYSATGAGSAGLTATNKIGTVMADIMYGRKDLSVWDAAVKDWQTTAGNKMRDEYEQAFAAQ